MKRNQLKNLLLDHMIEILLILLVLIMTLASPNFLTLANLLNILRNQSMKGLIAFGMTMVIIAGQIDLSVGSAVALAGVIVARFARDLPGLTGMDAGLACALGILVALGVAVGMGYIHASAQHKLLMPAFIVTLASLNLQYGLAGMISQGFPIANVFPKWFLWLGIGKVFGSVPVPVIILCVAFVICHWFMNYTTLGRTIYASGGNAEAARLSGINVFRAKVIAFAAVQVMCVIAGFIHSAQVASGSYSFGRGWEVDVISAVVIGGTSMSGGIGRAWGTMMGILFLGVLTNAMTILDIDIYTQYVIKGLIMAFAVWLSTHQAKAKA
ncbi:MAG: ABC transporter permease [Candidatus Limiplasma sp.]|nr:ABC transporter permease [Candidatus Limiplasma sp.]